MLIRLYVWMPYKVRTEKLSNKRHYYPAFATAATHIEITRRSAHHLDWSHCVQMHIILSFCILCLKYIYHKPDIYIYIYLYNYIICKCICIMLKQKSCMKSHKKIYALKSKYCWTKHKNNNHIHTIVSILIPDTNLKYT